MNKTALLVIYNHRFDKNISRIKELYKDSFSHVYQLIPFYDGDEPNVIPVYDSSFYFQSFICQAYTHLKGKGFTHYFVVADDLILNPAINETNLWEVTGLPEDACMLPKILELQDPQNKKWPHVKDATRYRVKQKGLEVANILPSYQEAIEAFQFHGISTKNVQQEANLHGLERIKKPSELAKLIPGNITLSYPLVGGYSDICLITEDCMQRFCSYCGAFAAGNLFVEIAIPTAMMLASKNISFIEDLKLKRGDMWTDEEKEAKLGKFEFSLDKLIADFPSDTMYLHPIKLSAYK